MHEGDTAHLWCRPQVAVDYKSPRLQPALPMLRNTPFLLTRSSRAADKVYASAMRSMKAGFAVTVVLYRSG